MDPEHTSAAMAEARYLRIPGLNANMDQNPAIRAAHLDPVFIPGFLLCFSREPVGLKVCHVSVHPALIITPEIFERKLLYTKRGPGSVAATPPGPQENTIQYTSGVRLRNP